MHIVAFANTVTMCLVLTEPRASTPEILETQMTPVMCQSPIPKAFRLLRPICTKALAEVHSSLEIAGPGSCSGQAISANNTENSRIN